MTAFPNVPLRQSAPLIRLITAALKNTSIDCLIKKMPVESLIIQKSFPDDVSSKHRPCIVSETCNRSLIATTMKNN